MSFKIVDNHNYHPFNMEKSYVAQKKPQLAMSFKIVDNHNYHPFNMEKSCAT